MTRPLSNWRRFGRFNAVGLLGAGLQVTLLWMLSKWSHLPILAATVLAVELTVLHNFVWHLRFTWRDRCLSRAGERWVALLRFHLGNACVSIVGNAGLIYLLVERLRLPIVPSAGAAIVACSVVNFLLGDRWVYSRPVWRNCPSKRQ